MLSYLNRGHFWRKICLSPTDIGYGLQLVLWRMGKLHTPHGFETSFCTCLKACPEQGWSVVWWGAWKAHSSHPSPCFQDVPELPPVLFSTLSNMHSIVQLFLVIILRVPIYFLLTYILFHYWGHAWSPKWSSYEFIRQNTNYQTIFMGKCARISDEFVP